jgi:glycosyltransferase involved in cell wall biosynthesis
VNRWPNILPDDAVHRLDQLGRADLVVGIPSYNNARTIGHVVRAVQVGLAKYFPSARAVIVNSDGGSVDGTQEIVRTLTMPSVEIVLTAHPLFPIHRLTVPYHGIPGKGSAFRCIFQIVDCLGAQACAVVDSDLRSITPEWVQLLLAPIVRQEYDYVAPFYLRHKYDGTITNTIVYPMTRALYGERVRQPIGGDFGVAGPLAAHFLKQDVWDSDVARYGIDIWMTTTAICEGFRVCQSFLGAKLHDAKDPGSDLSAMLVQVVGTVFTLMETHEAVWKKSQGSRETPIIGFPFDVGLEPVNVDLDRMFNHFKSGVANLSEVWRSVISNDDLQSLHHLAEGSVCSFHMDDRLWARMMYDFSVAFHRRVMDRSHLMRSTLPLYMGRVASFVKEVASSDAADVERRLEQLCEVFESEKDRLRRRWNEPAAAAGGA